AQFRRARAAELCVDLGYEVAPDDRVDTIVARVAAGDVDVLLTALPGGEAIVEAARARSTRPPVIAIVDPPADTAFERADTAGADLFVVRPLARDAMAAALRGAAQLRIVRDRLRAVEGAEAALRERLLRYGESDSVTGFQHIDFFQKLLVIELKRARRYGYPLAVVLVAIDPYPEEPSPAVARQLRTRVATAISACIREIDIPVDFADDRFLVFLPYTPLDGAERVGRRIAKVVASYGKVADGDREHRMSVSVGIAALKPGRPVSFARLIRDAKAAVRAAQLKGGGQVVVRR
ncbi:MAG: GGDEF domain-containing protein, partial [Deltaproteobacteria bacterium]